jgi:hypothetical protein
MKRFHLEKCTNARAIVAIVFAEVLLAGSFAVAQQPPPSTSSAGSLQPATNDSIGFGVSSVTARNLLQANCTRCHIEPQPQDVNREYWPLVLHWMARYAGYSGKEFPDIKVEELPQQPDRLYSYRYRMTDPAGFTVGKQIFKDFHFKTDDPPLKPEDWETLRAYFVSRSVPLKYSRITRPKQPELQGFEVSVPPIKLPSAGLVLAVAADPARGRLFLSKGSAASWASPTTLHVYDMRTYRQLSMLEEKAGPPQTITIRQDGTARVTNHGSWPAVINDKAGSIFDLTLEGRNNRPRVRLLANSFSRLIQANTADLDGDGLEDIVTTSFADGILEGGGGRGQAAVFWQTPQFSQLWQRASAEKPLSSLGGLQKTVLLPRAGMMGSAIGDFNKDGLVDVAVLTAQAQQQVLLFLNKGDRKFDMRVVIDRTPSFGHISIKAGDFNKDGKLDLLVLNGNNVEMVFPRPQHGIRILENNGDLTFTERFEYPMHGASRAVVEDFDGDGDLDIAAIALWPEWETEEPETFVYLENQGNLQFKPSALATKDWGAWADISSADVNGDNKPDIILGYGIFGRGTSANQPLLTNQKGKEPWVMYLLNKN